MLAYLVVAVCVLGVLVPVAFYAGFTVGYAGATKLEEYALKTLEVLRVPHPHVVPAQPTLSPTPAAPAEPDSVAAYREMLLDRFNKEVEALRKREDEEVDVRTQDGRRLRVRSGDLEPLGPGDSGFESIS